MRINRILILSRGVDLAIHLKQGNVWVGKWNRGLYYQWRRTNLQSESCGFSICNRMSKSLKHISLSMSLPNFSPIRHIFHLYAHVNSEIKFIQAVSGFDRDLASSTAILSPQNRRSTLVFPGVDHMCRPVRFFALIAWFRKMSDVGFKTVEERGEGECWS